MNLGKDLHGRSEATEPAPEKDLVCYHGSVGYVNYLLETKKLQRFRAVKFINDMDMAIIRIGDNAAL